MSETQTLISVIIPCYNQADYLSDALEAILNQTYTNWECIIINDGSTDNTEDLALDWCKRDYRFKYIKKNNGGLSAARNAGLKVAKGEFIQFLDADDLLEYKKLEIQHKILYENESIDLVYSPVRYFLSEDSLNQYFDINLRNEKWQPEISGSGTILFEYFKSGNFLAINCPLVKTSIISKCGLFNEHLRSLEDYEFWSRLALNGAYFQFDNTENTFALVRVHQASMSRNSEVMYIYYCITRFYFLRELRLIYKYENNLFSYFEFRSLKKQITIFYLNKKINKYLYSTVLNFNERIKLRILNYLPKRLKFQFMMFDKFEIKRFLKIN